jgi:hypothetical protein
MKITKDDIEKLENYKGWIENAIVGLEIEIESGKDVIQDCFDDLRKYSLLIISKADEMEVREKKARLGKFNYEGIAYRVIDEEMKKLI